MYGMYVLLTHPFAHISLFYFLFVFFIPLCSLFFHIFPISLPGVIFYPLNRMSGPVFYRGEGEGEGSIHHCLAENISSSLTYKRVWS
jgi:hypothetical protein